MVVYRKLNNECIGIDSVPLLDLHSAFDWYGKAKYFTILDLNSASAYHQIPLAKDSGAITSFVYPGIFTNLPASLLVWPPGRRLSPVWWMLSFMI